MYRDALGSLRVITDATGHCLRASDYYAFGAEYYLGCTGATDTEQWAGLYSDAGGDLSARFRRYSPDTGRWLSPDPADIAAADPSSPQSWNRYAYALNNPVNLLDPRGLDSCDVMGEDGICWIPSSWGASEPSGPPPGSVGPSGYEPTTPGGAATDAGNSFIKGQTNAPWNSCSPSGLSNKCSPGYQFGQELALASNNWETQVEKSMWATDDDPGAFPSVFQPYLGIYWWPSSVTPLVFRLSFHDYLKALGLSIPGGPGKKPSGSQGCGAIMSQWADALRAWTKAHPGQPPPASLATPPNPGACG